MKPANVLVLAVILIMASANLLATDSYIVTLRQPAAELKTLGGMSKADRGTLARRYETAMDDVAVAHHVNEARKFPHALRGFAAAMDAKTAEQIRKDPRVLAVELDRGGLVLCEQTNSTGILRMGVTNFPVARINGLDERIDVDVAVLDTGIQTNHPDLNVVQAVNCTGESLGGDDWNGHGTFVAGIIGALDNDFGVVGVAPGVRLWAVQVFPASYPSDWTNFFAGVDYIAQHSDQISVVNASLGSNRSADTPVAAISQSVQNVINLGIVFVAAAGNEHGDILLFTNGSPYNIPPPCQK